ncbi:MAG: hypothetical protein JKY37_17435 [Nannocystaceae bacterium]|nr:hypothetical protein [Nannocystaceae bacterium]
MLRKTMRLEEGGVVATRVSDNGPLKGTYAVDGDTLTLSFDISGHAVDEVYQLRIDDGRLLLWSGAAGRIFARADAPFEPSVSRTSEPNGPTTSSVHGVAYSLKLPAMYGLVKDGKRERWDAPVDDGLYFEVTTQAREVAVPSDGSAAEVSGCPSPVQPMPVGRTHRGASDGPTKLLRISTGICLQPGKRSLRCDAGHSRGSIRPAEQQAAELVCQSLRLAD